MRFSPCCTLSTSTTILFVLEERGGGGKRKTREGEGIDGERREVVVEQGKGEVDRKDRRER